MQVHPGQLFLNILKLMQSRLPSFSDSTSKYKGIRGTQKYLAGILLLMCLSMIILACQEEIKKISIKADEFRFTPEVVRLRAWESFHLVVINQGREIHQFKSSLLTNRDTRIQWKSEQIIFQDEKGLSLSPGYAIHLVVNPPPGSYGFQCPIQGHRGMQGVFIVEEAGSSSLDRDDRA